MLDLSRRTSYNTNMRVPSRLIYSFSRLSLTELKIFFLSLHKKLNPKNKIEIPFRNILKSDHPGGSQYSQISEATKKLMQRVLICYDDKQHTPGIQRQYIHYLQYAEHDTAILSVKQSKELKELIDNSHIAGGYINVNIRSIINLHSWYSARLYILFCQKLKAGFCSIEYENLKTVLKCSKIYDRQQNFLTRCVFDPLKEINEKTDIKAKLDVERTGHRVKKFYFSISARADRGDMREFLEDATAERIEKDYPGEYIKYCLLLTKKIHKPEKGTIAGLFLKILHNNFNKWKIELDGRRKFLQNKDRRPPEKINGKKLTREQYLALPDFARKTMDASGGIEFWTTPNKKR